MLRGDAYDDRWRELEAAGLNPHGEADLVFSYGPGTVLDAGCGTGRVARELARRGCRTVGVDLDPAMLATARSKAPELEWHDADLAQLDLRDDSGARRHFDAVVLAGNVMIFLAPGSEPTVVARLGAHVRPGGLLIAGFQLRPGGLDVARYDRLAAATGLERRERFSTWERAPFAAGGDYVVLVHARRAD